jgi:hypothetical protein
MLRRFIVLPSGSDCSARAKRARETHGDLSRQKRMSVSDSMVPADGTPAASFNAKTSACPAQRQLLKSSRFHGHKRPPFGVNSVNTAGLNPSTSRSQFSRFGSRLGIPAHVLERKEAASHPRGPLGGAPLASHHSITSSALQELAEETTRPASRRACSLSALGDWSCPHLGGVRRNLHVRPSGRPTCNFATDDLHSLRTIFPLVGLQHVGDITRPARVW